jgi:hypothetical protein
LVLYPEFKNQLTHKNWTLELLRNIAEGNAEMKGELEKCGIDVKAKGADGN